MAEGSAGLKFSRGGIRHRQQFRETQTKIVNPTFVQNAGSLNEFNNCLFAMVYGFQDWAAHSNAQLHK